MKSIIVVTLLITLSGSPMGAAEDYKVVSDQDAELIVAIMELNDLPEVAELRTPDEAAGYIERLRVAVARARRVYDAMPRESMDDRLAYAALRGARLEFADLVIIARDSITRWRQGDRSACAVALPALFAAARKTMTGER